MVQNTNPHLYVALMRGINVGGKTKINMAELKTVFEKVGCRSVKTYINSGNICFEAPVSDHTVLAHDIHVAVEKQFGFGVPTILKKAKDFIKIAQTIPSSWTNDSLMKCDVMFLWDEIDSPKILRQIIIKPELEDVKYIKGALLWRIDRKNVNRGGSLKLIGTDMYKKMTIRNSNTVRKLVQLINDF